MSGSTDPSQFSVAQVLRKRVRGLLNLGVDPLVALLARLHISPNVVSVVGFAITALAAWPLATGHFVIGGLVLLGGSATDMIDGALARATGSSSKRGGFLDSNLDRVAEAGVLFGLLYYFADRGETVVVLLVFAVLVASVLVSFVKARAEGLGLRCDVGVVTRPERVLLLGAGLISGQIAVFLYIVAAASLLTFVHRFMYVWTQAGED